MSSYRLKIEGDNGNSIMSEFRADNINVRTAINNDGSTSESATWYEAINEIKNFSKKHPDNLFILDRDGEENSDVERSYFKNGKVQVCMAKITFEKFDESKLRREKTWTEAENSM